MESPWPGLVFYEFGNAESLTNGLTTVFAPKPNGPVAGLPTNSGAAQVGDTLTAERPDTHDQVNSNNVVFASQWLADHSDIPGKINYTGTLVDADESKSVGVEVSLTDDRNHWETGAAAFGSGRLSPAVHHCAAGGPWRQTRIGALPDTRKGPYAWELWATVSTIVVPRVLRDARADWTRQ